jgi:SAM-dependent methyltransferase
VVQLRAILTRWRDEAGVIMSLETLESYDGQLDVPIVLHACPECDFQIFLPGISGTTAFYRDVATNDQAYYVADRWEFARALRYIGRMGKTSVLDIGCGRGDFLTALCTLSNVDAYGYEFNDQVAEKARSRGLRLLNALEPIAAFGHGFDVICLFQVLEHFADPFTMLTRIGKLLRPEGRLIVCVPDAAGPVRHYVDALTDLPPHHVTRWSARSMRACAEARGYAVEDLRTEPLGDYVWDFYLPVILEKDWLPPVLARWLVRRGAVGAFLRGLKSVGIRQIWPLSGHTLFSIWRHLGQT